jgi:hypothetical protein
MGWAANNPPPYASNMGSRERAGVPLAGRPTARPVEVNLDLLFPGEGTPTTGDGLVLRGSTAGALHRWLRSAGGQWVGVCTMLITRADGGCYQAVDQLVPARALRPR